MGPRLQACLCLALTLTGCGARTDLDVDAVAADIGEPDRCVEVPRATPEHFDVEFTARVVVADVVFLLDATSSMGAEIGSIQRGLRDILVPELLANVPDVRIGIASFRDFDTDRRRPDDYPFRLHQAMTTDVELLQAAVDEIEADFGGDGPESQVEALYQLATGAGRGRHVPAARCRGMGIGYPCFREEGTRMILLFTDAAFHYGPGGALAYPEGTFRPRPATYTEALEALRGIGAKVLGFYSGEGEEDSLQYQHLRAIVSDTGASTSDGEPLVFDIGTAGWGLGVGVAESVRTLVEDVPIDIDLLLEDVPGDALDARLFVSRVEALQAAPAAGATVLGDRFDAVVPGTRVTFRVHLENEGLVPGEAPRRFRMRAVLRGDRITRLSTRLVDIVVPAVDGVGCGETAGP